MPLNRPLRALRTWHRVLGLLLSSAGGLPGQAAPPTAADVTEPGRDLGRCLDIVLASVPEGTNARTVLLAIDPTASVAQAGFADELERALLRQQGRLANTRLALGTLAGRKKGVVTPPTQDHASVVAALRQLLAAPSKEPENVFEGLRALGDAAAQWPGVRDLLLVTFDNNEVEDELDSTVERLRRAAIRVHVLTTEVTVADSYWSAEYHAPAPRGAKMVGGDAPFIDLPYGFLMQINVANEVTPSGYGPYALTRLSAATQGRVFLHTPPSAARHSCSVYGDCLFCNGDHVQPLETFRDAALRRVAPPATSRADAYREANADPLFRAVQDAWGEAARCGLLWSLPPQLGSTSAGPGSGRRTSVLPLFDSLQFDRNAKRAEKGAEDCTRIAAALTRELDRATGARVHPRAQAIAELLRVDLQILRTNLLLYAGWCREIAPARLEKDASFLPPEVSEIPAGARPIGIVYGNFCLCHGAKPFLAVELPGGEAVRGEIVTLDQMVQTFRDRWAGTPYVIALHRAGLARFWFGYAGKYVPPPRLRPKSKTDDDGTTTPQRPQRPPPTTGGGSGGPTTGGGGK